MSASQGGHSCVAFVVFSSGCSFSWLRWPRRDSATSTSPIGGIVTARRSPGALVDVGGYRLHMVCAGVGSPTVILDSGLGGSSFEWQGVAASVATFTRVCAYDRAGQGFRRSRSLATHQRADLERGERPASRHEGGSGDCRGSVGWRLAHARPCVDAPGPGRRSGSGRRLARESAVDRTAIRPARSDRRASRGDEAARHRDRSRLPGDGLSSASLRGVVRGADGDA